MFQFTSLTRPLLFVAAAAFLAVNPGLRAQQPTATTNARTVQEIGFSGNHKFSDAQLAEKLPLKIGDVNTKDAIRAALDSIVQTYRQSGSDLSLMVDISLPDKTHTIVHFLIDENGTGGSKGAAPRGGPASGTDGPPKPPAI